MAIIFEGVSKGFSINTDREVYALHNISFRVEEREFVSIVGPSGCGKTTLLKIAANLSKKTSGS